MPSYDLNWEQFAALVRPKRPGWFEPVIHQHMPMFHMEHCVFAAFLSNGKDWRDCGRPCDRHKVELRDRVGAEFPVLADTGCRNTVFNARAAVRGRVLAADAGTRPSLVPRRVAARNGRGSRAAAGPLRRPCWPAGTTAAARGGRSSALNQLGVTRGTLQMV